LKSKDADAEQFPAIEIPLDQRMASFSFAALQNVKNIINELTVTGGLAQNGSGYIGFSDTHLETFSPQLSPNRL